MRICFLYGQSPLFLCRNANTSKQKETHSDKGMRFSSWLSFYIEIDFVTAAARDLDIYPFTKSVNLKHLSTAKLTSDVNVIFICVFVRQFLFAPT